MKKIYIFPGADIKSFKAGTHSCLMSLLKNFLFLKDIKRQKKNKRRKFKIKRWPNKVEHAYLNR